MGKPRGNHCHTCYIFYPPSCHIIRSGSSSDTRNSYWSYFSRLLTTAAAPVPKTLPENWAQMARQSVSGFLVFFIWTRPFLKEFAVAESTINWCSPFHLSITLSEKKSLRSSRHRFFTILALWPSVLADVLRVKMWLNGVRERQSLEHPKNF